MTQRDMPQRDDTLKEDPRTTIREALGMGAGPVVMERIRRKFVRTRRDTTLAEAFTGLLADLCERPDGPDEAPREAGLLLVLGESGAGKTRSLKRMFASHPGLERLQGALLSLSAPSPCGVKELGVAVLEATDYRMTRRNVAGPEIWSVVRRRLRALGILVLHIDEAQHATQLRDVGEREKLRNTVKGLLVDPVHPVAIVLSGLPGIAPFVTADQQLSRRATFLDVAPVTLQADRGVLRKTLEAFTRIAGLTMAAEETARLLPRLIHASDRRLGILLEEIHAGLRLALDAGADELKVEHFAQAFADRTGNAPDWNPYRRADYASVDAWRMLARHHLPLPAAASTKGPAK